jgi:hypothetical protein
MSYVIAAPVMMTAAVTDLATIGSTLREAHAATAAATLAVAPAAADEVSAGIAQLFSQHARDYQALAGQAAAFHEQFTQNIGAGAAAYASTEAASAQVILDDLQWLITAPLQGVETEANLIVGQLSGTVPWNPAQLVELPVADAFIELIGFIDLLEGIPINFGPPPLLGP